MAYRMLLAMGCVGAWLQTAVIPTGTVAQTPDGNQMMAEADRRIEEHRKADAQVVVLDPQGNPVEDAQVTVEQTGHAFLFGCNFFKFGTFQDPQEEAVYRDRFRAVFNFATLPYYWPQYEPRRGQPRHARAVQTAEWCREHGIRTKGHPLAWNYSDPHWLPEDSEQCLQLQLQRITDCVSRMRGLIDTWDVVNEATHFDRQQMKDRAPILTRMWRDTGQVEFVDLCFEAARKANSQATMLINDYRNDDDYAQLIDSMANIAGKRAYDVIGLQSHMHRGVWENSKIWDVCERFRRFDVPLHFTELTILSGDPGWRDTREDSDWPSTEEGEQLQAAAVERVYTMLFSHPSVMAITWWDFADRGAWQGAPAGFLRKDLSAKPAYEKLVYLLKEKWWTKAAGATNAEGRFEFRGFLGDFSIRVRTADGRAAERAVTLDKDQPNRFEVRID